MSRRCQNKYYDYKMRLAKLGTSVQEIEKSSNKPRNNSNQDIEKLINTELELAVLKSEISVNEPSEHQVAEFAEFEEQVDKYLTSKEQIPTFTLDSLCQDIDFYELGVVSKKLAEGSCCKVSC